MIKIISISAIVICSLMCGSMWYLGHLAFGEARVSGVNAIPAAIFLLVIFATIFFGIYTIFASLDWVNDWAASKSAKRSNDEVKSLRDVTNLVSAQTRALAAAQKVSPTPPNLGDGGLLFDDSTFSEKNLPNF